MKQIWLKKKNLLLAAFAALFLASCVEKFTDDYTWESSIRDRQLSNPKEVKYAFSPDGASQTLTWSMVMGAGGYEVTVYIVDNPENPVVVGDSAQLVDGFTVTRPAKEDTRYRVEVRTLPNEKMNNTVNPAEQPTLLNYNNLVAEYATIPDGTDLHAYFTSNPVPQDSLFAIAYQLVGGGSYTMSGNVDVGGRDVIFRSTDNSNPPTITISSGGFMSSGGMLRLHYLNIDHTDGFDAYTSSHALIRLNDVPAPIAGEGRTSTYTSENGSTTTYVMIPSIVLRSCNAVNIKGRLLTGGLNNARYAVAALIIENSILGFNGKVNAAFIEINMRDAISGESVNGVGVVKDITVTNSTLFNTDPYAGEGTWEGQGRFWRQATQASAVGGGSAWGNQTITLLNNTFWQMGPRSQSGNGTARTGTIRSNVFINSFGAAWGVINDMVFRSNNVVSGANTTWYDAKWTGFGLGDNSRSFEGSIHAINSNEVSTNVNPIITDPEFTVNVADIRNPVFSMGEGTTQVRRRTGDPRWLPQQ